MPYIKRGNLWLPCAPKDDPILLFVDETYLTGNTGFVQACVAVTRDDYQINIIPKCRQLLTRLGRDAKEFKGSKIKEGNVNIYREFLQLFINHMASISDISSMRSIITVDSYGPYSSKNFNWLNPHVIGAMQNLGLKNTAYLASEFTRQILWLYNHWPKLCGIKYHNPLIIIFDEKHNYAQQCQEMQFVSAPGTPAVLQTVHRTLTSFANILFSKVLQPFRNISKIQDISFGKSHKEFGLQAADLLTNLMFNCLKSSLGLMTPGVKLRENLLLSLMPAHNTPAALVKDIQVQGVDIKCVNNALLSTFQLVPGN